MYSLKFLNLSTGQQRNGTKGESFRFYSMDNRSCNSCSKCLFRRCAHRRCDCCFTSPNGQRPMNEPVYELTEQAKTVFSKIFSSHPSPISLMHKISIRKGVAGLTFFDTINILHNGRSPLETQPREHQVPCKNIACKNKTANLAAYCDIHYQLPQSLKVPE